jgi:predicted kinase
MKKLIIWRGLPGSGKSFQIQNLPEHAVVCSADHFFDTGTAYNFDQSKLGEAHAACQLKAFNAMAEGRPLVVIDNTNSRKWEYALYEAMGKRFGYVVEVRTIGGQSVEDVRTYAERNIHNVPEEVILKMAYRWEA